MANLWLLLKIQILRLLTGRQNSKKVKAISGKKIGTGLLLFLVFFGVSLTYAFMYAELASITGQYFMMFQAMLVMYLMLSILFGIYDAVGLLFGSKDYDFLASLPIKKWVIVFSKLLYLYLLDFAIAVIVFTPTAIVFSTKVSVPISFFLALVYNCIFVPFIPLVVTLIIGVGIKLIFSGLKKKALIETIFTMVLAVVLAVVLSLGEDNLSIYSFVEKVPVINWFLKGLLDFKFSLFFSGVSIALGALACVIVSIFYSKINTLLARHKTTGNYKVVSAKQKGLTATLIKKEFTTLLGIPVYAVNILIAPVLGLAVAVVLVVIMRTQMSALELNVVSQILTPFILPALLLVGGLTPMSAPSVSLEGKNFDLLKTLPLSAERIIGAKYIASFCVSAVNIILPAIIAVIGFAVSIGYSLIIVLGAILGVVAVNSISMTISIRFAKFDWDNPTYPVKQGASVGLSLLANFLFAGLLAVIAWLVSSKISIFWSVILSFIYLAIVSVLTSLMLINYGVKRFKKL